MEAIDEDVTSINMELPIDKVETKIHCNCFVGFYAGDGGV